MEYLKSVAINRVGGPNISNEELRHLEGQRYIVAMLDQWSQRGQSYIRNAVPNEGKKS